MQYRSLDIERQHGVVTLWLNRPQVRNALDEVLIGEITDAVTALQPNDACGCWCWPGAARPSAPALT